jgi:hypothetical protein
MEFNRRNWTRLKAPARSTLRDSLRSSLAALAAVLTSSGSGRGGRPLSVPPCSWFGRAFARGGSSGALVPPHLPAPAARVFRPARCRERPPRQGHWRASCPGTGRLRNRSLAGSAWLRPRAEARATRGRAGPPRASTLYVPGGLEGRARSGKHGDVSTAATEGSEERSEPRDRSVRGLRSRWWRRSRPPRTRAPFLDPERGVGSS